MSSGCCIRKYYLGTGADLAPPDPFGGGCACSNATENLFTNLQSFVETTMAEDEKTVVKAIKKAIYERFIE